MKGRGMIVWVVAVLCGASGGCDDENERLAAMAQQSTYQQAQQNAAMAENARVVAEGSKALVEAETQSRQEMILLQRDLRGDQAELGRQRDALERDRRQQALSERRESLLAPALVTVALLLACVAPLIVAGFSLLGLYIEPTREEGEALLTELWLKLQEPANTSAASPRIEQEQPDDEAYLPLLAEAER